jgi:hypothetical protein
MRREWLNPDYSTVSGRAQGSGFGIQVAGQSAYRDFSISALIYLNYERNGCRIILQSVQNVIPPLWPGATMSRAFFVSRTVPDAGDGRGTIGEVQPSGVCRPKFQEKRKSNRFPVQQDLRYRAIDHWDGKLTGTGLTLDMSGSGIRFSIQERIPLGRIVEVSVDWPVQLDGTCPLKMVVVGRVVRSEANWAALSILQYEFRTKGSGLGQRATLPQSGADANRRQKRTPRYRTARARDAAHGRLGQLSELVEAEGVEPI